MMKQKSILPMLSLVALASLMLVVAGCTALRSNESAGMVAPTNVVMVVTNTPISIAIGSTTPRLTATPAGTSAAIVATSVLGTRTAMPATLAALPTATRAEGEATNAGPASAPTLAPQPVAEMKAGEIDDNKRWDNYLRYRQNFLATGTTVHDVDITERHIISVLNGNQSPVLGARVRIYGNQTLLSDTFTYANGQTLFFPRTYPEAANVRSFEVVVTKNGQTSQFMLTRGEKSEWQVALKDVKTPDERIKLDVLFLLDATGSMGDEIAQLQSNILSISSQINALPMRPDVRFGMVTYRDREDSYVTQIYQFTPDINRFQSDLRRVQAGGGGDTPESVNAGLHDAIHGVEWRDDNAIKLIFLVADAPPHLDYPDDYDYAKEMVEATRRGIKIFSLAASGLDQQGEFIFRQLAQYTMGHFIFLTYEKEGQGQNQGTIDPSKPGDNTSMNVPKDDFTVELLDKLVVRLIRDELALLTRQVAQSEP
jgi:Mg-chelatase subunit ChlD